MSMSLRPMSLRQSVSTSSQPQRSAKDFSCSALRPQAAFSTGWMGRSKKCCACFQALLWALPMNLSPMIATFNFFMPSLLSAVQALIFFKYRTLCSTALSSSLL